MRNRPWPIIILAIAHFLAPIANILYSSWLENEGLRSYLISAFSDDNRLGTILYLLGFQVAGFAIYKMKRWSYPVFLVVMAGMMVSNFETWLQYPQYFGLISLVLSYTVNLGLVSYFLIPAVRNAYFDSTMRWWESKPRYEVVLPTKLRWGEAEATGVIQNISEGGVYVQSEGILLNGNEIEIGFSSAGKEFCLTAKVVHRREAIPRGVGLQFAHSPESERELKALVQALKGAGARARAGDASLRQEFKSWAVTALSTGKGLVPPNKKDEKNHS